MKNYLLILTILFSSAVVFAGNSGSNASALFLNGKRSNDFTITSAPFADKKDKKEEKKADKKDKDDKSKKNNNHNTTRSNRTQPKYNDGKDDGGKSKKDKPKKVAKRLDKTTPML